jgi:hypothetical protein
MKTTVISNFTPCSLVCSFQHFCPGDEGSRFLRNVGTDLPNSWLSGILIHLAKISKKIWIFIKLFKNKFAIYLYSHALVFKAVTSSAIHPTSHRCPYGRG